MQSIAVNTYVCNSVQDYDIFGYLFQYTATVVDRRLLALVIAHETILSSVVLNSMFGYI